MRRPRLEVADALRAFALLGILQVNIQSYAWGAGDPLGYFIEAPAALEAALYLLTATFVSSKFLSLFAFLFGFGFALQWRALRRRQTVAEARSTYRRRLYFLLALGVAHGMLLYYGDILTAYALVGLLLLHYAPVRPAALAASTVRWWIGFALLTLASTAAFELLRQVAPADGDVAVVPDAALERWALYTQAGYLLQLGVRVGDYLGVQAAVAMLAVPQLMGLFLLGTLAGRLGWLAHPQRHTSLWRTARWIGWAALPFAAAGAWVNFVSVRDAPGDPGFVGYALQNAGSLVACLYVAAFVGRQQRPLMRRLIAWLAPAGRMPLTNYLLQSLAMGLLLSGWGLGLGASLGRVELAVVALAIACLQLLASRHWIRRFGQGPFEALWRYATYGRRGS